MRLQENGAGKQQVRSRHHSFDGFTLIELMIVIAIVSILVTLAVPAYKDFTVRAKVIECISMATSPKLQISEFFQVLNRWPDNAAEAAIDQSFAAFSNGLSNYCRIFFYNDGNGDFAIWVNSQAINSNLADGRIIPVLSPVANLNGNINWVCTRGFTDITALKYLPSSCRGTNMF